MTVRYYFQNINYILTFIVASMTKYYSCEEIIMGWDTLWQKTYEYIEEVDKFIQKHILLYEKCISIARCKLVASKLNGFYPLENIGMGILWDHN